MIDGWYLWQPIWLRKACRDYGLNVTVICPTDEWLSGRGCMQHHHSPLNVSKRLIRRTMTGALLVAVENDFPFTQIIRSLVWSFTLSMSHIPCHFDHNQTLPYHRFQTELGPSLQPHELAPKPRAFGRWRMRMRRTASWSSVPRRHTPIFKTFLSKYTSQSRDVAIVGKDINWSSWCTFHLLFWKTSPGRRSSYILWHLLYSVECGITGEHERHCGSRK